MRLLTLGAVAGAAIIAACASQPASRTTGDVDLRSAGARYDIAYRVGFNAPETHLYRIDMEVGGIDRDTLRLQMPVWSPGRYARMDFARNVQKFTATTSDGSALTWDKENGSLWRVVVPQGRPRVRVRYEVYANNLSGTFSVLDTAHANWNGAALFMYVEGHKPDPVKLHVDIPQGWHLINGAAERLDQADFTFPTYDHLIDTPTEVAPRIDVDSFRVDAITYRVAVHHNGDQHGQRARFVDAVKRIVEAENRVIAPPPITTYTFLFNIGYAGGDGMEHLTSTQIINRRPWTDTAKVLPGVSTASHEYFHTWNVKRIRPIALGPFDYTSERYQPSLWVAEGWTQYYGDITMHRAGIVSKDDWYLSLARILQGAMETPARKERSARMASFDAPFFDGAAQPMEMNSGQTFLTYYTKGEILALALDLKIRAATGGTQSLDNVLRVLKARTWDATNASYYLQGRGYTEVDIERAASDVFGGDLHDWFNRYVGGTEDLPWDELLGYAGLRLESQDAGNGARRWVITEKSDATAAQRRVRDGWLSGR